MPLEKTNVAEYSVAEIAHAVKRTVEENFNFVRVRGEISGYRGPHASGHAYFALKDQKARIEAVIWRGVFSKLTVKPEEGLEVIASGKLTTYPGSSKYQIVIESIEPAGEGALMALLEARRKKLLAEGLFEAGRKQELPYLPAIIGVITSPTGAVIRDILHRISDRFPLHVLLWPVRVQGETCSAEVATAIRGFNALESNGSIPKPDILIVARGGGSIEDLWGFNEEDVVRAVAQSDIAVISAVGHETDWTLIDHAADKRAPTPTGAAEMAVPVRHELVDTVTDLGRRLNTASHRSIDKKKRDALSAYRAIPSLNDLCALQRQRLDITISKVTQSIARIAGLKRRQYLQSSTRLSPNQLRKTREFMAERIRILANRKSRSLIHSAERLRQKFTHIQPRLLLSFRNRTTNKRQKWQSLGQLLTSVSYTSVLQRGYTVVMDEQGQPVTQSSDLNPHQIVALTFHDGNKQAVIHDELATRKNTSQESNQKKPSIERRKKEKKQPPDQGQLL